MSLLAEREAPPRGVSSVSHAPGMPSRGQSGACPLVLFPAPGRVHLPAPPPPAGVTAGPAPAPLAPGFLFPGRRTQLHSEPEDASGGSVSRFPAGTRSDGSRAQQGRAGHRGTDCALAPGAGEGPGGSPRVGAGQALGHPLRPGRSGSRGNLASAGGVRGGRGVLGVERAPLERDGVGEGQEARPDPSGAAEGAQELRADRGLCRPAAPRSRSSPLLLLAPHLHSGHLPAAPTCGVCS